jgi:alanine dehydrogenase
MIQLTRQDIDQTLDYPSLIAALREGFRQEYQIPTRMHTNYENPADQSENTLLLMPAIAIGNIVGVKIVNVAPKNGLHDLPSIHGVYYVSDANSGQPLALMDAKALTNWRTAATSALAADYLAREDSSTLLVVGTGSLAPYLIDAHAVNRPIKRLLVYGRNTAKAEALATTKVGQFESVEVVENLPQAIAQADIISTATLSKDPLIHGDYLQPGQHLDLVGSYKPDLREADNVVMRRGQIYADQKEPAIRESGDLALPISEGIIQADDIVGDLFQLCRNQVAGRQNAEDITVFKSVGHALEDLVGAQLILSKMNQAR